MAFKKLAASAAAALLIASTSAAQAATASSLSLSNAARAATASENANEQFAEFSPLYVLGAVVVVVGILEVTEAINIFGDDEPDSP